MSACQRKFILFAPGCRTNLAEGEGYAVLMEKAGWERTRNLRDCSLALMAGCVVTEAAERDARRFLRRVKGGAPGIKVAVLGCLAERLARYPDPAFAPDLIVRLVDRWRLPEWVDSLSGTAPQAGGARRTGDAFFFVPTLKIQDKSRYFFKIQDGCDAACAYCLVRRVRGPLASLPMPRLLDHMRRLVEGGVKEVIFCGTRLGSYGKDLTDGTSLDRLAVALEALPGEFRWRLSSLEPWDVTAKLLDRLVAARGFCRFFHIPLQSGSDGVLTRMNRPYRAHDYRILIEAVRARIPGARIGTDVIAGFPGETRGEFDETLEFLSSCPVDYLHLFSFSKRPGLPDLPGALPGQEIKARRAELAGMDARMRERYRRERLGSTTTALSLGLRGILEDNHTCRFEASRAFGAWVPCSILGWDGATARVEFAV